MDGSDDAPEVTPPAADRPDTRQRQKPQTGSPPVDMPYAFWLATVATALMAAISVTGVLVVFLIDNVLSFSGGGQPFGAESYSRMLGLAAVFAGLAVLTHLLRLRFEAMRRAVLVVPLPFRVAVEPPTPDLVSRFEISCDMSLGLDHAGPQAALASKPDILKKALEDAFLVAVTDPVLRFSKQKMEQAMKAPAVQVLGQGVAYIEISNIRQRRLPPGPAAPREAAPDTDTDTDTGPGSQTG